MSSSAARLTRATRLLAGIVLPLLLLPAACGPSNAEIVRARQVSYQAPYATVWNVVAGEVRRQFRVLKVENAVSGRIESDWKLVEKSSDTQERGGNVQRGGTFFRVVVRVEGPRPGPFSVQISGEAAQYRPEFASLQPLRDGDADQPGWVKGRIDRLYFEIYDRLQAHAIEVAPAPADPRLAQKVHDDAPWGAVPPAAVATISAVHDAARRRSADDLLPHLAPRVVYGEGSEAEAANVVASWSSDPTVLAQLAETLRGGCATNAEATSITCPPADRVATPDTPPPAGWATFQQLGEAAPAWKLVRFTHRAP